MLAFLDRDIQMLPATEISIQSDSLSSICRQIVLFLLVLWWIWFDHIFVRITALDCKE